MGFSIPTLKPPSIDSWIDHSLPTHVGAPEQNDAPDRKTDRGLSPSPLVPRNRMIS